MGGRFDVWSSLIPRLRDGGQRIGMEWSSRLVLDPRRSARRSRVTKSWFVIMTAMDMWQQVRHGDQIAAVTTRIRCESVPGEQRPVKPQVGISIGTIPETTNFVPVMKPLQAPAVWIPQECQPVNGVRCVRG
jgi:hypothetical protein